MTDLISIDNSPEVTVIEPTRESQDAYGLARGAETLVLQADHLEALQNGQMLALPINGGEYALFIVLEKTR